MFFGDVLRTSDAKYHQLVYVYYEQLHLHIHIQLHHNCIKTIHITKCLF